MHRLRPPFHLLALLLLPALAAAAVAPPPPAPYFTKRAQPVWEGTLVAGDPCVVRYRGTLRMYYTSVETIAGVEHIMIACAESDDGVVWRKAAPAGPGETIALDSGRGWDRHLETCEVVEVGGRLRMWYAGYEREATETGRTVATGELGLAVSEDGVRFTRAQARPVLTRGDRSAPDFNALYSPAVVLHQGVLHMLYTGWAIDDGPATPFIGILAATSRDGIRWSKRREPVLSGPGTGVPWIGTLKEVDLVRGPDGVFYLFFSTECGIGLARGPSPVGPFQIHPAPMLVSEHPWESAGVIAPSVLIEDGRVRLWYMGFQPAFSDFAVGYAEARFPFAWPAR